MVIQGYLISENTDLLEIESQIQKVQKKILNIRQKEYQHLLGKEIAFCCDCIALNILQRPTQGSIADCAVDNLNRRIQVAQLSNLPSPYNLSIFLHVLQLDGKAYLRVDCNNPIFQKAFRSLEVNSFWMKITSHSVQGKMDLISSSKK